MTNINPYPTGVGPEIKEDFRPETERLRAENARLQRELDEALRQLRKSTGANWAETIAARALPWIVHTKCETCKGLGEISVDRWASAEGVEPRRCDACKGLGEVYDTDATKMHHPDQPPCAGCPNPTCNDFDLCSRKKNPQ